MVTRIMEAIANGWVESSVVMPRNYRLNARPSSKARIAKV
jgi:hypothetical protein